jgi:threonine/homoserine/homoserine lactone efflux protein
MSIETLLTLSAISLLVFILPSPSGRLILDYVLSFGRMKMLLLVVPLWLAHNLVIVAATLAWVGLSQMPPTVLALASWIAAAYLVVHVLWSLQSRFTMRIADNDNLPVRQLGRSAAWLPLRFIRPRLALALISLLVLTIDSSGDIRDFLILMLSGMAAAALAGLLFQIGSAYQTAQRIRLFRKHNPAWRKPRTQFIARRAVSAGYRQIAA